MSERCAICRDPRGTEKWTRNGGRPSHVRCALGESARALEGAGLRRKKKPAPPKRGRPPTPGALRREGYRVSLLLSEEDLGNLDRAADKAGVSRAEAVREAVRAWVEEKA